MRLKVMAVVCAGCALLGTGAVDAQEYPTRPIRFISPYPPGGFNDALARLLAQKLNAAWGKPVVVDNRPGAHVILGTDIVAKAPPDGHTMLMTGGAGHTSNPALYKLPYDSVKDFAPVILVAHVPNILVIHPSLPASNVKEFIALLKTRPGQWNYGSVGSGSSFHLAAELFQQYTGTKMVHVPYKGGAGAINALVAGEVQVYFGNIVSVIPHVRSGRLKALGVTAAQRSGAAPELPTLQESGVLPGFEASSWYAILTTARTPEWAIRRLNAQVREIMQLPDVKERLLRDGAEPTSSTPEQLTQLIVNDIAKWAKVVQTAGIKVE